MQISQDEEPLKKEECKTLRDWGYLIMLTENADLKAQLSLEAVALWQNKTITELGDLKHVITPKRPQNVQLLHPRELAQRKRTLEGRIAMIHALVHIENMAIMLTWDLLLRFDQQQYKLPIEFFDDWVRIAGEESRHYSMLNKLLTEKYGKKYGDFPAHDGLWEDAIHTKDDLLARLMLEHCVNEGRGIDVTSNRTIPMFEKDDKDAAKILKEYILPDEVTHVREGLKWFKYVCKETLNLQTEQQIIQFYQELFLKTHKQKILQEPFDKVLRLKAGMTEEYYMPFAKTRQQQQKEQQLQKQQVLQQQELQQKQQEEQQLMQSNQNQKQEQQEQ